LRDIVFRKNRRSLLPFFSPFFFPPSFPNRGPKVSATAPFSLLNRQGRDRGWSPPLLFAGTSTDLRLVLFPFFSLIFENRIRHPAAPTFPFFPFFFFPSPPLLFKIAAEATDVPFLSFHVKLAWEVRYDFLFFPFSLQLAVRLSQHSPWNPAVHQRNLTPFFFFFFLSSPGNKAPLQILSTFFFSLLHMLFNAKSFLPV